MTRVSKAHSAKREELASSAEAEPAAKRAAKERAVLVIGKASTKSEKGVVESLGALKLSVNGAIDEISAKLTAELETFRDLQEASVAAKVELENIHGIKAAADSLEALQRAQDEERDAFNVERLTAKATWEEEKRTHIRMTKEAETELAKRRQRDQDQYDYDTAKKRKEAEDAWQQEQQSARRAFADELATKIAELTARETNIAAHEAELVDLRAKVAQADEITKKEIARSVAIATNSLKKDLEHDHAIAKMELQNQLNLKNAEIVQQQKRNEELTIVNKDLDAKYKESTTKVQEIAQKAIEGASRQQTVIQTGSSEQVDGKRSR